VTANFVVFWAFLLCFLVNPVANSVVIVSGESLIAVWGERCSIFSSLLVDVGEDVPKVFFTLESFARMLTLRLVKFDPAALILEDYIGALHRLLRVALAHLLSLLNPITAATSASP